MRKINTQDVFKAFRLITKSGLKDELTKMVEDIATKGYESVEKVGLNSFMTILETLTDEKSEKLFYDLLSGIYEMTPQEVANLDPNAQIENLTTLYKENNLKGFFIALQGLLNKKS